MQFKTYNFIGVDPRYAFFFLTMCAIQSILTLAQKDALQTPAVEVQGIDEMVDACFRRFGELASGAGWPSEVMNDQGSIEDGTSGETWLGALPTRGLHMNRICLRRFLNVFLIMYRHIYMQRMAVNVEGNDTGGITVNVHHAVAGGDDFDNLSMCWDLMPSARLNYMHDFHGMYNCVSQVRIFFFFLTLCKF
jgi:hypothetical protein